MQTVTIQRSKWACSGNNKGASKLLNENGNMCCLGFAVKQLCGKTDDEIRGMDTPIDVLNEITPFTGLNTFNPNHCNNEFSNKAMEINDDDETRELEDGDLESIHRSVPEKEVALIQLFKENGINLVFED